MNYVTWFSEKSYKDQSLQLMSTKALSQFDCFKSATVNPGHLASVVGMNKLSSLMNFKWNACTVESFDYSVQTLAVRSQSL